EVFGGWRSAVAIGASVGLRGTAGRLSLTGALGGQVRISWEQLERHDATRIEAAGYPPRETDSWTAGGPRATFEAALPLGHQLAVAVFAGVTALLQRELENVGTSALTVRPLVIVGVALQRRF